MNIFQGVAKYTTAGVNTIAPYAGPSAIGTAGAYAARLLSPRISTTLSTIATFAIAQISHIAVAVFTAYAGNASTLVKTGTALTGAVVLYGGAGKLLGKKTLLYKPTQEHVDRWEHGEHRDVPKASNKFSHSAAQSAIAVAMISQLFPKLVTPALPYAETVARAAAHQIIPCVTAATIGLAGAVGAAVFLKEIIGSEKIKWEGSTIFIGPALQVALLAFNAFAGNSSVYVKIGSTLTGAVLLYGATGLFYKNEEKFFNEDTRSYETKSKFGFEVANGALSIAAISALFSATFIPMVKTIPAGIHF